MCGMATQQRTLSRERKPSGVMSSIALGGSRWQLSFNEAAASMHEQCMGYEPAHVPNASSGREERGD